MRYEDNSQAGGIAQGQAPDARDDADALTAGTKTPAEGNVITGEGTKFGPMSSDQADGGHITKLTGAHGSDSNAADGKLSVQGEFGHLTMDAQGNYHYTPKANVPENSRDVFTYTLADNSGRTDTADLTIEFGKTPPVVRADAQQIVPGPDGVVVLPEGVQLSDVIVVGRNLVINLPDGTQMVIVDGAVFVPQLVLGGVEVPPTNLASLLIDSEPVNTGAGGPPPSSGGNFEVPVPPLDPGVPLGDLIPPTEMSYTPPEVQEVFPEEPDNEPTILIDPGNGVPVINAIDSVNEAGLPTRNGGEPAGSGESADGNGSNNSDPSEATTGTILYDSPDGVQSITITGANGVPVEAVIGAMIPGQYGTMFITDVVDGVITYRYVLNDNTSGDNTHDDFSVTITDPDGDQATATLQVNIVDDVPNAVNDTDSIAAGEYGPATGNVITDAAPGDAGDSDNGADTVGADNAHVTSISGSGGSDSSFEGGFLEVDGQYGTLRIYANGDYEYVRDAGTPGGVSDVFTYTLTDGDGDTDTATLTITIDDALPITGENAGAQLDDDALANGNPGGVGDDPDAVNTSGTLAGSGGDGPLTWALSASGAPAGFTYQLQGNGDLWVLQGGTHVLTVTLNAANGQYSVEQVAPIDHAAGGDENNVNFTINYTVSDVDGDSAAGSLAVNVDDDTPTIDPVLNREGAMTLDESLPSGPATIDTGAIVKGDDPDLAGGQAIGSASSGSAIVDLNASFGADGPAAGGGIHYELDVTNANSGLTLTDGSAINLVELPNGVVVGVVSGGAFDGQAAFAISIDPVSGVVTVEQYLSLDHPVNPDPNDPLSLGEGSLSVVGTATDGDGDTVSTGDIDISNLITFLDDGPSIDPVLNADATVTVDESLPSTAPTINLGSYSAGDDPDLAGGLALGHATSGVAIVDANAVFGADGPAAGGGIGYALSITNADSGLTLTDGTPISLVLEGGVIIGVVQGGTFDGDAAFAIAIDPVTGVVTVEQYLSLDHPVNPDPNDPLGMGENTVAVVVTATDGDGDPVSSDAIDISGQITFLDDGPTVDPTVNAQATVTVDESLPSNTPGIDTGGIAKGNDPDLAGGLAIGQANSGAAIVNANAVFGADGPAAEGSLSYALSIINANSGLTTTEGDPISLQLVNGVIVGVVQGGAFDGQAAFAIAINSATGVVTVEQYLSLDHPLNPNPNDPLSFGENIIGVTVTATDGDGDPVTSDAVDVGGQITFLDDGPSANNDSDTTDPITDQAVGNVITGSGTNEGTGNADVPGADGFGSISGLAGFNGSTDTNPAGGFDVNGQYGTLHMNADGSYTYTRTGGPGGAVENFVYTYVDGDGDPASATLTITIADNTPVLPDPATVLLDDDALAGGNPGGTGDDPDSQGLPGQLAGSGGDGALTYNFTGLDTVPGGFTVNHVNATTVQVLQGATVVLTITLNQATGAFNVVQNNPIDHPAGSNENNLSFSIGVEVEDIDGDTDPAVITINVDDDTPTVSSNATVQLDDDALANGNPGGVGDDANSANTSGTLGHSYGADGAGSIAYATTGAPAGFTYQLQGNGDLWVMQGATHVLTLTVNATSGAYTVTQVAPIDHPAGSDENNVSFSISYIVTDHDGDTATGSILVNVDDDTPTVSSNATVQLDDDALANGNPGGVGDDANSANTSGTLGHSYGADGAGSIAYATTGAPAGFTYQLQGNGDLWVMQGATHVLTLTVNATSGAYTVTQVAPIDHPAGSDENNVSFSISYIVTDHDGDTATGSILVNVDDDTPTVSSNATVQLDDDALANGNPGGVGDDANSANTSGTLGHSYGADGAGSIAYATTGAPAGFTYQLQGNGDLWVMQGATHVLTLTVNATSGAYTVTQVAPIDHPAGSDENNVSFSISYVVTDHDGDTATGSILVNVDDDTPTVSSNATVQLDDDALANGNPGGTGDDPNSVNTSGTLSHSYGADGAGSIVYSTSGAPGGFTYQLQGNGDLWVLQGATHVLTLTVNATSGAYTVTQVAPINHPAGGDENNVSFSISYIVTDHDGDTATGSLLVNVDDDTPTATATQLTGTVDEDGLTGGIAGGTGDVPGEAVTASGNVGSLFNSGADTPLAYQLVNASSLNALGLTSGGTPLSYQITENLGIYTLTASAGGATIFTLTLNIDTGAYQFTLAGHLDHATGLNENDLTINLSSIIQASDHDGDVVAAGSNALIITVDDDSPVNFTPVGRTDTTNATASTLDDALVNDGTAVGGGFINDSNANPANGENFIGADGFGSLTFSGGSNGDQLENSGGDPLTSGGDPILVTGYGTNTLTAYVESGAHAGYQVGEDSLVFVATLATGAGYGSASAYNIQFYDTIDNGSGVSFDNLTSTAAGNVSFRGVGTDDPNTAVDLLLSAGPGAGVSVNTDSDSVGAANQSMNAGETVRIDFVSNLTTDGADPDTPPSGFNYGAHVSTGSFFGEIPQVQGNQAETVAFTVWALDSSNTDAAEPDRNPAGGFSDATISAITEVTVQDYLTGNITTLDVSAYQGDGLFHAVNYGISVRVNADGSVTFSGIQEGDHYGFATGSDDFNAVVVQANATGTGGSTTNAFDLGVFSIGIVDNGDPVNLTLGVTATDADGDTSTGNINITLVPDAPMMAAALGFKDPVQSSLSTNTGIVAGAAAAVGLAAMPLAAEQSHHASTDSHADMSHMSSSMSGSGISARSLAHDGDGDITSMFASGGHALRGLDAGNDASSARALPDSSHSGDLAGANAAASAKDAGPQVQADHNVSADAAAASQAAPVVNMPSAAALQAAGLTGHAASGDSVGHVVAEALGLHDAPTVDGLLAHLGSVHDMRAAAAGGHDASGMESSVQGWDMGGHMAIAAHADVLMTMSNLSVAHHDAVPPAVNG